MVVLIWIIFSIDSFIGKIEVFLDKLDYNEKILELQKNITSKLQDFKVEKILHLTLVFIGSTDKETEQKIIKVLNDFEFKSFEIELIPEFKIYGKNALALEVKENHNLIELSLNLRKRLTNLDISFDDKEFKPHILLNQDHVDLIASFVLLM